MRAARLLHILLLLQNRGRQTSVSLATELEVSPRTILRDVDAMTEAGLPIIVHQGNQGGIELGFDYRMRLTGLTVSEADALALILHRSHPELDALGLGQDAAMAVAKVTELFSDKMRARMAQTVAAFALTPQESAPNDPRILVMAQAVRQRRVVRLRANQADARTIHPVGMAVGPHSCAVTDARDAAHPIPLREWGSLNISAKSFD